MKCEEMPYCRGFTLKWYDYRKSYNCTFYDACDTCTPASFGYECFKKDVTMDHETTPGIEHETHWGSGATTEGHETTTGSPEPTTQLHEATTGSHEATTQGPEVAYSCIVLTILVVTLILLCNVIPMCVLAFLGDNTSCCQDKHRSNISSNVLNKRLTEAD